MKEACGISTCDSLMPMATVRAGSGRNWATSNANKALALSVAILLAGCARGAITAHVADNSYTGRVHRVLVIDTIDPGWSSLAPDAFRDAITQELGRCDIQSEVYDPSPLELNQAEKVKAMISSFGPDAILNMQHTSSMIRSYQIVSGTYVATVLIPSRHKEVWKATLSLSGDSYGGPRVRADAAADLARQIVGVLAHDDILQSCPPSAK